jgi:hypothetical protein
VTEAIQRFGARSRAIGSLLALCLAFSSGCAFHRLVSNEEVRNLDPSGIVAGESTIVDVIFKLGLPPADLPEEVGTRGVGRYFLRWAVFDSRCFRIGFEQLFLITPFRWCSDAYSYDISVEFDDAGVVTSVFQTERENVWRPFGGEKSAEPTSLKQLSGGMQP